MHAEVTDKESFTGWGTGPCDWSLAAEWASTPRGTVHKQEGRSRRTELRQSTAIL